MHRAGVTVVVGVMGVLSVGCVPNKPPMPTEETSALEGSLLTVADVGNGFVEEKGGRGPVGVSGGSICPESDFGFEDVGMLRAAFLRSPGSDDEVGLVEMLRVVDPGEIDELFAELRSAYEECEGLVWTDYGDTQTVKLATAPDVGDDQIAVREIHGDPPFDGSRDDIRLVYVRTGDVFIEVSVSESVDSGDKRVSVSDDEFDRIVATAVAKIN